MSVDTHIGTVRDVLRRTVREHPTADAVVWGERQLCYRELMERSLRLVAGLRACGLGRGDRCAIWASNTGEFVEFYLAAALGGTIAVPINFRFTAPEADYVLRDSGPRAVLIAAEHVPTLLATPWWGEHGDGVRLLVIDTEAPEIGEPYEAWLTAQTPGDLDDHEVTASEPFFIGYTSGTTGAPKGAMVAQGPMLDNCRQLVAEYGHLSSQDRFLTLMPLFHSNSTWFAIACVLVGAANVVAPSGRLDGRRIVEFVEEHEVTATSVVPTILQMMLEGQQGLGLRESSLRAILCGSAPLTVALKKRVIDAFEADLYEGYGATETGIVTSLHPDEQARRLGSVGRVVTGKEIELRDAHGLPVAVGEVGELWCRGEGVLLHGYRGNPAATESARDSDGWHTVGDMARVDADGFYELVDRKNDMIISGGENVYPTEVEEALLLHPAVREVAVIGLPDDHWGERVHAVVVAESDQPHDSEALLATAAQHVARFKLPRTIEFVTDLPRTPTGKIQRRRVRDRAVDERRDR